MPVWSQILVCVVACVAAGAQGVRWLRVLQREHYEPAAMMRFLGRWTSLPVVKAGPVTMARIRRPVTLSQIATLVLLIGLVVHATALVVADALLYGMFCPVGLSLRGRTSPLHWTRRLRTVAVLAGLLLAIVLGLSLVASALPLGVAIVVWGVPPALGLSARILGPYERRQSQRYVDQAARRLAQVRPLVVGITGSYGKTSTKNHLADIMAADGDVVATPKSFNNRAGLSRAINEGLSEGTRVFIAEMGTYGPGEIAELCDWCPPSMSIITAIGPVHLERMGSLDVIEKAKFEITQRASTVIVNADDPRLAQWPARLGDRRVRTAGSVSPADVRVVDEGGEWHLFVDGVEQAVFPPLESVQPTNLACAIAAALELGCPLDQLAQRVRTIRPVANRANVITAPSGVVVIDDTFNANPASAAASLALLRSTPATGRRVVITPGMIELGPDQFRENAILASRVSDMGAELVAVGRTNVPALFEGYDGDLRRFEHRDDAVAWVRSSLGDGDAVLYLNDLPDHYP